MKIILNGQPRELLFPLSLNGIIENFCQDHKHVIAEVNGDIIKRPDWSSRMVCEGDTVELVNIVGGG